MMGLKRPTRIQARIGVALATVLTGGGLVLTASGGIAAETTRKVEETVRTQVIERVNVAPSVAAVEPVAPVAPVTPVAAVAPVAAWDESEDEAAAEAAQEAAEARHEAEQDRLEVERDVAEAMREAHQEMREAQAEARAAAREAAIEARAAARVAQRANVPHTVRRVCDDKSQPVISTRERGRELLVVCTNFQPIDREEMRRTMIEALEGAREGLVEMEDETLDSGRRASAIASLDRQLARLRSERH